MKDFIAKEFLNGKSLTYVLIGVPESKLLKMRGPNNEEFNNSLTVLEDSESLHSHDRTTYFVYIPETKEKKDYEIIGKECLQKQFSEYNKSNFVLSLNRI